MPTRGVLLEAGTTPFNTFIHEVTRQGGFAIDYPDIDKNASAIKCIHLGSDGTFRIPSVRNINLVLDEQSKGIGISGIRVPPSDTMCIVSVPIANSSSRVGAGSQKRGRKETRSDLKEKGWEAKQILAVANRAISCGIPTVVLMPKGNPLWGREFVKRWSESHGLYPVKMCSFRPQFRTFLDV